MDVDFMILQLSELKSVMQTCNLEVESSRVFLRGRTGACTVEYLKPNNET